MALSIGHHHAICAISLSDRQAADAVRGRIDWKYTLRLELTDPGFDASVRSRVPHAAGRGPSRRAALDGDADALQAARLAEPPVATSGRIRRMCWRRFAPSIDWSVWEKRCAMRFHCLAIVAPEWLLAHSQPEWVDRYEVRLEDSRLPSGEEDRQAWVQSVGQDGATLPSRPL